LLGAAGAAASVRGFFTGPGWVGRRPDTRICGSVPCAGRACSCAGAWAATVVGIREAVASTVARNSTGQRLRLRPR